MTPRPAYLWFLVWTQPPRKEYVTAICGFTRKQVRQEFAGDDIAYWRQEYRRGARILRCKVTVTGMGDNGLGGR